MSKKAKVTILFVFALSIMLCWRNYVIVIGQTTKPEQTKISSDANKDLNDLVETEKAFAAIAVKEGWRGAFIKFFADDGIGFGPHPERTKEVLQKRPPQIGPRTIVFNWQPIFGDISAAGDMGYTTGPVLFTDLTANPKPPWHGMYFSVWQKQKDGTWKVAIDIGVDTPEAVAPINTKFTAAKKPKRGNSAPFRADDYRLLDKQFNDSIAKTNALKAYNARVDGEFRIHRNGRLPVVEKSGLEKVIINVKFEFIDGKIADSNDLAFTYGKYISTKLNMEKEEDGYYVHVWRRDETGKWRLVADVQNPLPKKEE